MSDMKIAIFLPMTILLQHWRDVVLKELKIYQKINEIYGVEFIFLTYEENLEPEVNDYPEFKFMPSTKV